MAAKNKKASVKIASDKASEKKAFETKGDAKSFMDKRAGPQKKTEKRKLSSEEKSR